MKALAIILREAVALFVDDGALAGLAVAWVAISAWVLPLLLSATACALLLFAGLAAALAYSIMRA